MADHIGQRIEEARRTRGLSQAELADRAGLTRATVNRIEHGKVSPTIDSIQRIASVLGVTMDELFSGLTSQKAGAGVHIEFRSGYDPREYQAYLEYLSALSQDSLIREGELHRAGYFKAIEAGDLKRAEDLYYRFRAVEQAEHELRMRIAADSAAEEPAGEPVKEKNNV